jgi:ElaB/YqjD/DUF883 family membrane-anchored ribosome-binding protein
MTTHTQDFTEPMAGGPQRLTDAAGEIAQQATSAAEQRASSTMTQVGDTLEHVAEAVRGAGENLRAEQPQLAGFADTAAQRVESAAQYLRDHDAGEVIDGAQDFARRQPAIVVGAGLALGLLVGRALKTAHGSARSGYRAGGQWSGTSRYGASGSYGDGSHGTSSSYEASGGYGTSGDYTGGAASSSLDADRADDPSASNTTALGEER